MNKRQIAWFIGSNYYKVKNYLIKNGFQKNDNYGYYDDVKRDSGWQQFDSGTEKITIQCTIKKNAEGKLVCDNVYNYVYKIYDDWNVDMPLDKMLVEAIEKGIKAGFKFSDSQKRNDSDQIDFNDAKIDNAKSMNAQMLFNSFVESERWEDVLNYYEQYDLHYKVQSYDELLKIVRSVLNSLGDEVDLNWLDVHDITGMAGLFRGTYFNGDISEWDVSNVEDMGGLFQRSHFDGDISKWNVGNVKNMANMFAESKFNNDISGWNVSNVENMNNMFYISRFDKDISNWNVSNVKSMCSMFGFSWFCQNISNWKISADCDMSLMFDGCYQMPVKFKPKKEISEKRYSGFKFNKRQKANKTEIDFNDAKIRHAESLNIEKIHQEYIEILANNDFNAAIDYIQIYGDVVYKNFPKPKISDINNYKLCFIQCKKINDFRLFENIIFYASTNDQLRAVVDWFYKLINTYKVNYNNIDVSQITDMHNLFMGQMFFDSDISEWDVSNVVNMSGMFDNCENFNQPLNKWDVSNVTNMNDMFANCDIFNQPLNDWDVSNVELMYDMFKSCHNFNQPLDKWNTSNVKTMSHMFNFCDNFNQNINSWNVSNVQNMSGMFWGCSNFNQPLNNWNVSNVTNMSGMFNNCKKFNQSLDKWNVSNIDNMEAMFSNCNSFNQQLNMWDISKTKYMLSMFKDCKKFNQDLSNWRIHPINYSIENVFLNSGMSEENYPTMRHNNSMVEKMSNNFKLSSNHRINDLIDVDFDDAKINNVESLNSNALNRTFRQYIDNEDWPNVLKYVDIYGTSILTEKYVPAHKKYKDFMYFIHILIQQYGSEINLNWIDVSRFKQLDQLFSMTIFNGDISEWDVSNVESMCYMFASATFNGDISKWNVSNVQMFNNMFDSAKYFNQDISKWDINQDACVEDMFKDCPIDYENMPNKLK